jgi:hypothetical protein
MATRSPIVLPPIVLPPIVLPNVDLISETEPGLMVSHPEMAKAVDEPERCSRGWPRPGFDLPTSLARQVCQTAGFHNHVNDVETENRIRFAAMNEIKE